MERIGAIGYREEESSSTIRSSTRHEKNLRLAAGVASLPGGGAPPQKTPGNYNKEKGIIGERGTNEDKIAVLDISLRGR